MSKQTDSTRRGFLKTGAGVAAATTALAFPFIRNASAVDLELRWLGWEHYNSRS